eukprot:10385354-Ditylum_brightwellii.AAC.1
MGLSDLQNSATETLQALADATTEDRTAVANLLQTNGYLNKQVNRMRPGMSTPYQIRPKKNMVPIMRQ